MKRTASLTALLVTVVAVIATLGSAPAAQADDHPVDTISNPPAHEVSSTRVMRARLARVGRQLQCAQSSYVWYLDSRDPSDYAPGVWDATSADGFVSGSAGPTPGLDCTTRIRGRSAGFSIVRMASRHQAREFDHFLRYVWCYQVSPCYYLRQSRIFVVARQFTRPVPNTVAAKRLAPLGYTLQVGHSGR